MKLAVIGSRGLTEISIDEYIPNEVSEIVSGGAEGVDTLASEYAKRYGKRLVEFFAQIRALRKIRSNKKKRRDSEIRRLGTCLLGRKVQGHIIYDKFIQKAWQARNGYYS